MKALLGAVVAAGLSLALAACSGGRSEQADLAASTPGAAADYALFVARCSKCHSLARPLNSGIDRDEYWQIYVERMRRQPGSGISEEDSVAILRFLHAYSIEQRRKKAQRLEPPPTSSPEPDASMPEAGR